MNLEFLKKKILERFGNVEAFAAALGLSKQAIYDWLGQRSKPEETRLLEIAEVLGLSEQDIDILLGVPPTLVCFRKKGLAEPDPEVARRSCELADTFFKLGGSSYLVKDSFLSVGPTSDATSIASYIRTLLDKEADEPVTTSDLLTQLKKHNISVFFLPFRRLGLVLTDSKAREVAFTARKGSRAIIFVDTERTLDEAAFDICHELVHLMQNHEDPTEDDEKLCNRVAQELIYPSLFFKLRVSEMGIFLDAKKHSWILAQEKFGLLNKEFDWSPKGLALSLEREGMIKSKSHEKSRLMWLDGQIAKRRKKIDTLFFANFERENYDRLLSFLKEELEKDKELYRPLIEIRDAAAFGRLSPRRLAELLDIDSGDADELVRSFIAEQPEDAPREEGNVSAALG